MKKIGVVGVPGGWSSETLADAVEAATGYRLLIDMEEAAANLTRGQVLYRDVDLCALDGLMLKKVGPAYSPDLLDRLEILRFIAGRGVRIFSNAEKVGRVLDRLSCTVTLRNAGITMPPTVVTEDIAQAQRAVEGFGPSVIKPLFTSKARGMILVEPGPHLLDELESYKSGNKFFYIQQRMELPGYDLGVVFLGGEYLTTYARVGKEGAWNTTTHSGGKYRCHKPSEEVMDIATRAQAPFGLDFTCVDVAETPQGPIVFEVSAFGGFRGLLEGCGIDAAKLYVDYAVKELAQ